MKNRYGKNLRDFNQHILQLTPANETLRLVVAYEFAKLHTSKKRTLEIGCGEGDSAKYLLENSKANIDLLDSSPEMVALCKKALRNFSQRTTYICEDALTYLEKSSPYDLIFSEWTIHNFSWQEKRELLYAIYNNLKPGGSFILMDKVYQDKNARQSLDVQLKRFSYLPKKVAQAIIAHEEQDFQVEFRMSQKQFLSELKKVGFTSVTLIDRVERDVVIVAEK